VRQGSIAAEDLDVAVRRFKKAMIERGLEAELTHHVGFPLRDEAGGHHRRAACPFMAGMTILQRSAQQWKLYLGVLLMLTGAAATARGPSIEPGPVWPLLTIVGGLTLTFGAGIWLVRSVRCPRCSARWLWMAATGESAGRLLSGLFTSTQCSVCGYPNPQRTSNLGGE
jgi:hypothetical protein